MTRLLVPLERVNVPVLAITAKKESSLGQGARFCIAMGKVEEAGNGLAPTTSTTLMLAIGDALSMAVQDCRGFTADQFAQFHPGGSLGRKLMKVHEVMRKGDMLPVVSVGATLPEVLQTMTETQGRPGACMVIEENETLVGMFTDGDLRRALDSEIDVHKTRMETVMHRNCITARPDTMAAEAVHILEENKITALLVTNEQDVLVGALNIHDLFRAGVM